MLVKMEVTAQYLLNNTWSGGYETVHIIDDEGKLQDLLEYLDEMMLDNIIDDVELNDFLWFNRTEILEALDIEY